MESERTNIKESVQGCENPIAQVSAFIVKYANGLVEWELVFSTSC
jgi:hypothetical protein